MEAFYYCCGSWACWGTTRRENKSSWKSENAYEIHLRHFHKQLVCNMYWPAAQGLPGVGSYYVVSLCMPERTEETDVIDQRAYPSRRRRRSLTRNIVKDDVVTCKSEMSTELYNMLPFIPYLPTRAGQCMHIAVAIHPSWWTRFPSLRRRINLVSSTCYCLWCFFRVGFTHIGKRF